MRDFEYCLALSGMLARGLPMEIALTIAQEVRKPSIFLW
jgi:hypothetical protein